MDVSANCSEIPYWLESHNLSGESEVGMATEGVNMRENLKVCSPEDSRDDEAKQGT
jgi:hypothetical protein